LNWTIRKAIRRLKRSSGNIYSGEYASFEEACADMPAHDLVGYDNAELASWYRERLDQVQPEDYPLLFWLSRILPGVDTVFDFGGHVGLHYYAWRRPLDLPANVDWTVCDVPAVVASGQELARERGNPPGLSLTSDAKRASGATVFLASGSIQYLEPGFLWKMLASLERRPRHLLLNKLAVHETRDFVTVQDTQASFHPYSVVSRSRLTRELEGCGYQRVAEWANADHCRVMLRPDLDVPNFTGALWTLEAAGGGASLS
jgi:putative methyltransferase (TIGR04325 family)